MYAAVTVDTMWYNGYQTSTSWRNRVATFQSGVGRQLSEATAQGTKTYRYDPAGNLEFTTLDGAIYGSPREDRFSYYGADSRLRAADYRFVLNGQAVLTGEKWVFEEYRYDALGRRIWVRTYRDCSNYSQSTSEYVQCSTSTLRRTVWSENAELVEIQVPGGASETSATLEADDQQYSLPRDPYYNDHNPYFGRVVYTPGLSIDRPIAVTRYRYTDYFYGYPYTYFTPKTFSLYWSPIGQMALATCADGMLTCSQGGVYMRFEYPAGLFAYDRPKLFALEFQGTLVLDKEDGAHTLYRRNRSYDPSTGRFTQEDPIGLAGGINVYGFAGGDPVNFSDPFGLCPDACVLEGGAAAGVGLTFWASESLRHLLLPHMARNLARPLALDATQHEKLGPPFGQRFPTSDTKSLCRVKQIISPTISGSLTIRTSQEATIRTGETNGRRISRRAYVS